jgi:hypothetical protein
MTKFARLRDGDGTEVERLLLGSAEGDAPMPGVRMKTLAALGLTGAAALTAGTAHAASAALGGAAGGKAAGSAAGATLAKWLIIGAVAGATTTGSVVVATTPGLFGREAPVQVSSGSSAPRAAQPAKRVAAPTNGTKAVTEEATEPGPRVDQESRSTVEPTVPRARTTPEEESWLDRAPAPQGTAFPNAGADTVAEEVTALDRARAALASGDAAGALARLDVYERRYPRGALSPEAAVLRVRALVKLGRSREARAAVDAFVRAHPGSPQSSRLRALVGD